MERAGILNNPFIETSHTMNSAQFYLFLLKQRGRKKKSVAQTRYLFFSADKLAFLKMQWVKRGIQVVVCYEATSLYFISMQQCCWFVDVSKEYQGISPNQWNDEWSSETRRIFQTSNLYICNFFHLFRVNLRWEQNATEIMFETHNNECTENGWLDRAILNISTTFQYKDSASALGREKRRSSGRFIATDKYEIPM